MIKIDRNLLAMIAKFLVMIVANLGALGYELLAWLRAVLPHTTLEHHSFICLRQFNITICQVVKSSSVNCPEVPPYADTW